uniref:Uncharacterized protein n=1 Tax=Magallana gigas TaxID=29159 RepID=K1QD47_MAGGI
MQTGRGVPVLIPNETNKVLDQPSNLVARQRAIIRPENNYMFANTAERVRWSRDEEDEIKKYFSRYFDGHLQKKCPSREHCLDALKKSKENGGAIFKRKWETLKKKVSNMLVKQN